MSNKLEMLHKGIKEWVASKYNGYIERANDEITDDNLMGTMHHFRFGFEDFYKANAYPLMCMLPDKIPINVFTATKEGEEEITEMWNFIIADSIQDPDKQLQRLDRYGDAFRDLTLEDHTLGGMVQWFLLSEVDNYVGGSLQKINVVILRVTVKTIFTR